MNNFNHTNNFTALRWLAASLVLYGHAFVFLGLPEPSFMGWLPLGTLGVYIFFTISGYLVAQSWESDPHALRFLLRRALRIFPGLFICTILSVFILGGLLTKLSWSEYIGNPSSWDYFYNVLLYISYYLPGVFEKNHYPNAVNGSLWSLPVEFFMYLLLASLGALRLLRFSWLLIAIMFMVTSKFWAMSSTDTLVFYRTDVRQVVICGVYFWMGTVFFHYKLSKFFSTTAILGAAMIWLSLSRWPELFGMAGWIMLPFFTLAFGLAKSSLLSYIGKYDYLSSPDRSYAFFLNKSGFFFCHSLSA
ncbi:acyltransferase family protein [Thiothrix lacustris]|uniref:acyltransferase family protein n=1 Tax=Thiothrix lacustris TaxID=525917 RepID=UPI000A03E8AA|nr:acyltransferase [Thiothrix lacustris]